MTSKYAINIGLQDGVIEGAVPAGVSLDERFMPEYFKDIGYDTHAVGKWHVGKCIVIEVLKKMMEKIDDDQNLL